MKEQKTFDNYSNKTNYKQDPWVLLLDLPVGMRKKVKDAVHKSIRLTKTEIKVIDTKQFQRLRSIKQTGPAYLLYPSAQHTRFEHSLGTLHLAQLMIDSINASQLGPQLISNRDIFITRLVALLHDLVHLPFGHTLEDEGRLFKKKQWQSEIREKIFFEPIAAIIRREIEDAFLKCNRESEGKLEAEKVLKQIKETLVQEETGDVDDLDAPYIADIVGNTICADLLDYVERDLKFAGLSGGYDELLMFYFTLIDVPNKNGQLKRRLVIKLFKERKKNEIRTDVLSGLVDLLRLRYSIGERVYYHHTKREASAMIIKMVAAAMKADIINEEKLCDLDDDSLIHYIRTYEDDKLEESRRKHLLVAKKLAGSLINRELYKPVYELPILDLQSTAKVDEFKDDWEKRYTFEEELAELLGVDSADLVVYIPSEAMGHKQAKALVQLPFKVNSSDVCALEDLPSKRVPADYKDLIEVLGAELDVLKKKHRSLWKLSVFVQPNIEIESKKQEVRAFCEQWFAGESQYMLVDILAKRHSIPLDPSQKVRYAEEVKQVVFASDTNSTKETLLSRYRRSIETLIGAQRQGED